MYSDSSSFQSDPRRTPANARRRVAGVVEAEAPTGVDVLVEVQVRSPGGDYADHGHEVARVDRQKLGSGSQATTSAATRSNGVRSDSALAARRDRSGR
jgi:hypothetical protein